MQQGINPPPISPRSSRSASVMTPTSGATPPPLNLKHKDEDRSLTYEAFVEALLRTCFMHLSYYGNNTQKSASSHMKFIWMLTYLRSVLSTLNKSRESRKKSFGARMNLPEAGLGAGLAQGDIKASKLPTASELEKMQKEKEEKRNSMKEGGRNSLGINNFANRGSLKKNNNEDDVVTMTQRFEIRQKELLEEERGKVPASPCLERLLSEIDNSVETLFTPAMDKLLPSFYEPGCLFYSVLEDMPHDHPIRPLLPSIGFDEFGKNKPRCANQLVPPLPLSARLPQRRVNSDGSKQPLSFNVTHDHNLIERFNIATV